MRSLAALLFHPSASAEKPDKGHGPKQADSFAQVLQASLGDSRRDSRSGLASAPAAEISPETQGTPPSSRATESGQAEDTLVAQTSANPRRMRGPSEAQAISSGPESTGKEKSARAHQGESKLQRAHRGYAAVSSAQTSEAPAAPTRRAQTARSLAAPPEANATLSDKRPASASAGSATAELLPKPSTQTRKSENANRAQTDQQSTAPSSSPAPAATEPSGKEHMPPNTSAVHHAPANPHLATSRPDDQVRSQAWKLAGEGLDAGACTPRAPGALAVPCGHLVPVATEVPSSLPLLADTSESQPELSREQAPMPATGREAPVETPVLVTPVDLDALPPQAANHFTPGENPRPQANQKAVEHANFHSAVREPSRPIDPRAPHTPAAPDPVRPTPPVRFHEPSLSEAPSLVSVPPVTTAKADAPVLAQADPGPASSVADGTMVDRAPEFASPNLTTSMLPETTEPPSRPQPPSEAPTFRTHRHDATAPAKHLEPKADGAKQDLPVHTGLGPKIEASVEPSKLPLSSDSRTTAPSQEDRPTAAPTKASPSADVVLAESEPMVTLPRPPSSFAQAQAIPAARLGQAPEAVSSSPAPRIFVPVSAHKPVATHGTLVAQVAVQAPHASDSPFGGFGTDSPPHLPPRNSRAPVAPFGSFGTDSPPHLPPRASRAPVAPFGSFGTDSPPHLPPRASRAPVAPFGVAGSPAQPRIAYPNHGTQVSEVASQPAHERPVTLPLGKSPQDVPKITIEARSARGNPLPAKGGVSGLQRPAIHEPKAAGAVTGQTATRTFVAQEPVQDVPGESVSRQLTGETNPSESAEGPEPPQLVLSTPPAQPKHDATLEQVSMPDPLSARPHDANTQARTPVPPALGQTAVADLRPGEPRSEPPVVAPLNHGARVAAVAREARGDGASEPSVPKSPQGLVHESKSERPEIRELNHGAQVATTAPKNAGPEIRELNHGAQGTIVAPKAENKPASPPAAPTPSAEPVTIVAPTPVDATPVTEPTSLPHHEGQADPVVLTAPSDHPVPQPKADHAARPAHQAPRSAHPGSHPHSEEAAKPIEASAPPAPQVESKPEPTSTTVESEASGDTAPVAAPASAPQGDAAPLPAPAAPSPPALAVAPVPADKAAPRSDANAPAAAPVATVLPAAPSLPTPAAPAAPPSSKVEAPQTPRRLWTAKDDRRFPEAPAFPAPAPQPQSARPHAPAPIPSAPDDTQKVVASQSPNPHASPAAAAAPSPDRPADLPVPSAPTSTSPSDVSALTPASSAPPATHAAPVEVRQPQLPNHMAPLAAQVVRDDGLNMTVMPHSAHMSIESSDGDLALHLRVRDGSADITVGGSMAPLFETRGPEARAALASEGLNLGRFDLGQQSGGGGQQGQPAPDRPEKATEPPTPYRHQTSTTEHTPSSDGRIHVTA